MMSAPALAKSSTRCSGSTIMRWQSRIESGCALRRASTTSGPMVMFGTKRPSITSTCTQSAPALSTSPTSWPSLEKFAERMDGEIITLLGSLLSFSTRGFARIATARAGWGAARPRAAPRRRATAPTATAAPAIVAVVDSTLDAAGAARTTGASLTSCAADAGTPRRLCCGATKAAAQPKVAGMSRDFGAMMLSRRRLSGKCS
mmetsp:Transcript_15018/g.38593  ORF Transcript_15018/g.38593 Transcript_15018/m.38593 type:complete len:203 (+) Transcript_15018:802-1410(+)